LAMTVVGVGGSQAWGQDDTTSIEIDDPRTSESSGLAVAPSDPDLLYTVNDSGHEPAVYTLDSRTESVVGTTTLTGPEPGEADPEAIAVDGDGTLWVADIGDNLRDRDDIALYALPAPGTGDSTAVPEDYPLSYPGGPADAETLLSDPVSGAMWVVTKGLLSGSVLEVPQPLGEANRLRPVAGVDVPGLVTDGTVLPDGSAVVLRGYDHAYVYRLPDWEPVGAFALPRQEQGESLTALPDGSLLAGSEGTPTRIDRVHLPPSIVTSLEPEESTAPPTSPPPTTAPSTSEPSSGASSTAGDDGPDRMLLAGGAVLGMLAAGGLALALVRRLR